VSDVFEIVDRGSTVARCSCWTDSTTRIGTIGQYSARSKDAGVAVLKRATAFLATGGCRRVVGPMDGNTWRPYRFIVERGSEPAFFLEPDHPDEWTEHWREAGFEPCETYRSALNDDLSREDTRTPASLVRLKGAGIAIRRFAMTDVHSEVGRIFALSTVAFCRNPYYAAISEEEFRRQIGALLPFVRPELVLMAERDGELIGFMFAVPDILQFRHGRTTDTVILKTIAVDPRVSGMGLGGALMDLVQRSARQLGFHRAIHALMHESNASTTISDRYARTFRRYALFGRSIETSDS
jgi:GNAT superfamily N-acetyltransferase